MNCNDLKPHLMPYADGELEPALAAEVEAALNDCPECQAELAEIQRVTMLAREAALAPAAAVDFSGVYDQVMAANLHNAFHMTTALVPRLDAGETTRMVFISSLAFRRGAFDHTAYSAAKGGITGLVRSLARRLAPGTLVNGLAPGHIDTPMPDHIWSDEGRAAKMLAEIPLERRGRPRECATVIDFLCSEASSYVTGQIINVDGGIMSS